MVESEVNVVVGGLPEETEVEVRDDSRRAFLHFYL